MPGKVPNMAQEVMGSTASISKGNLAELDLQEHLDDSKESISLDRRWGKEVFSLTWEKNLKSLKQGLRILILMPTNNKWKRPLSHSVRSSRHKLHFWKYCGWIQGLPPHPFHFLRTTVALSWFSSEIHKNAICATLNYPSMAGVVA